MKILLVHNYYKIPGGEDTVVENEKKMLQKQGNEVFLYSRKNAEMDEFSKIQKLGLPFMTIFNLKTYRDIKKILVENSIDIVHVHNTLNLISPSVYYAAIQQKIPVVQTIHNFRMQCPAATFYRNDRICEECMENGFSCAVKHKCYRNNRLQTVACVMTTKMHRCLGIYRKINYICLTEFNKEKLLQLNKKRKKNIVDPSKVFVKPNMTFIPEKKEESNREDFYLYAGRVEKIKGIELLIEAFEKMPEKKLIIAGTGIQLEDYKRTVSEKKIKNISFMGFVDKQQLQKLMEKAKALIVPSQWYEGFPMTIVEAFAQKTPVIGADIGNLHSIIEEGINGWKFCYDSSEALIEKVEECQHTPAGKLEVVCDKSFFPEGNYAVLMQIYKKIIQKNIKEQE